MPSLAIAAILGCTSALVTYAGVARYRRWAEKHQIIDLPNARSSHTRPTPRGGGITIVAVVLLLGFVQSMTLGSRPFWPAYLSYAAGALVVAGISWLDDLRPLPSSVRLAVQLLGALIAIAGLGHWQTIQVPLWGPLTLGSWGVFLAVLWIVGLTNAYNFMDGIDGIAGGQALIGGLAWAVLGWRGDCPLVGGLGWLLAWSSMGFLVHNWHPARIFMGDVGSAFLGYTLAVLPLLYGNEKEGPGLWLVAVLVVWPFVFDTVFTFTRRFCRHENVFAAHRSHLYQRMTSAHSGHARVALLYMGLALVGCALAQVWDTRVADGAVTVALALPAFCLALWTLVAIHERHEARVRARITASGQEK